MCISVIIPMFNSSDTIIDALESVRKQTRIDLIKEIIVVDDGSSDQSYDMVWDYKNTHQELNIILIRQNNSGPSSARNLGMKMSKQPYIAFLDSDDEWLPQKIDRQMGLMLTNDNIDFLGSNYNNKELWILNKHINNLYRANIIDLTLKFFPVTPSIIMKRSIFEEIGGFDVSRKYAEDGEYYFRICIKYNYFHLPETLVNVGHGKRSFGEKGLSSNLAAMYYGNIKNIKYLKDNKHISSCFYLFLRMFYFLKYIRRLIICKLNIK